MSSRNTERRSGIPVPGVKRLSNSCGASRSEIRENLDVVFLTPLQDSLMPGRYFYGTDNHLSTNGVTMRTAQVIDALTKQLQGEGIAP